MTTPAQLHFCWIGTVLPWAYVFAVLSAAERSNLPEIILHHTDVLADGDQLRALAQAPNVRLSHIDPAAYLTQTGQSLGVGDGLAALYLRLKEPVLRADVLRAAILYSDGGIYLDLDTVTVASLLPLTTVSPFLGSELIVWPNAVRHSRSPLVWARHLGLDVLRKALRRLPNGWRAFRRIETLYSRSVNNAVMGAAPHCRFFADYLRGMLALPPERQMQRFALGPHLLQELAGRTPPDQLTILPPHAFYPLPPEISEHWFATVRHLPLNDVLSPETRVVHWYASVRTKAHLAEVTPAYVRANRHRQLYSALVYSCIGTLRHTASVSGLRARRVQDAPMLEAIASL